MKALRLGLIAVLLAPIMVGVIAVSKAEPAKAEIGSSDLGDLLVLDGLFGTGDARDLAGLIAVQNATGGGSLGVTGGNSLGDLIVLNGLFNGGGFGFGNNLSGLAGLIAVSNLTGQGI